MKRRTEKFLRILLVGCMTAMLCTAVGCSEAKTAEEHAEIEAQSDPGVFEARQESEALTKAETLREAETLQEAETLHETEALQELKTVQEAAPLPQPETEETIERPKVRGIYVTGPMAGTENMNNLIDLVDRTELNALVIDVKNDEGRVVCEMNTPTVQKIGAVKRYVRDMPALVEKCKEKNIYLIARIVAFKDPFLAEAKPEWSLHNADGSIFRDKSGQAWINPYEKRVWDYLLEVAQAAVELGFDEVQFDYIRFSTDSGMKQVDFGPQAAEKSKTEVITEFTAYAAERLHEKGAAVSADVYGVVIDSEVDQQIVGQDYAEMARHLDYLSPMVYPSHYGPYNYDIPVPDAQPYDTVLAAMQASKKVLAGMEPKAESEVTEEAVAVSGNSPEKTGMQAAAENGSIFGDDISGNSGEDGSVSGNEVSAQAVEPELTAEEIASLASLPEVRADVRPWLQDFTATWVSGHIAYGPQQIREQIQAVYDAGYEEWILWNAANRYTEGGLLSADSEAAGS